MDHSEKKKLRERIGEHISVSGARLTDDEGELLGGFVDSYDDEYKGKPKTLTGWSSEGSTPGTRRSRAAWKDFLMAQRRPATATSWLSVAAPGA